MLCAGVLLTACGSDSDGGPSTPAPLDGGGDTGGAAGSAGGAGDVAVMQDASMVVDSGMHTMPQPDSGIVPMMDAMTFMDASQDAAPDAEPDDSLRPWPTDDAVVEVDGAGAFGTDVSGITYEAAGAGPGVIWAAMNLSPTKLYRLEKSGATWQRSTTNSWDNGKTLLFPDGVGIPDSEGVTQAELGSPIVYVGSERNLQGANAGASRMSVLSYDTSAAGASLTAQREWNLTGSLPAASSNQGIEAVTWIPDTALVGLGDTSTDATYDPTVYPIHGTGLFVVGVESQSKVFLFALGSDSAHVLIATAETGLQGVMGLEYDRDVGYLWAYCDNDCGNRAVILTLEGNHFEKRAELMRPDTLPNINNEGIAIGPESECVAGKKPFFWVEDGNTNGHVLRAGTIPCGDFL